MLDMEASEHVYLTQNRSIITYTCAIATMKVNSFGMVVTLSIHHTTKQQGNMMQNGLFNE